MMPVLETKGALERIAQSILRDHPSGLSLETFHEEFVKRASTLLPQTHLSARIGPNFLNYKLPGWSPTVHITLANVQTSLHPTSTLLDFWATLLPARVVTEDLGDYTEDINRRIARGQYWFPWVRVAAAMFWTGVNAIGYLRKKLQKRSGA